MVSTLKIINLYKAQRLYAQLAKNLPETAWVDLYHKEVIAPHWQIIAEGGEFIYLAHQAARPIFQLDTLIEYADHLGTINWHDTLMTVYERAFARLSTSDVVVVIMCSDPSNEFIRDQMFGIAGYAPGAGKIWLQIDPTVNSWRDWLETTFVHEFHHSAWAEKYYEPFDLATYLIFEGRAEAFVRALYPDKKTPWTSALLPDEEVAYWEQIKAELHTSDWSIMSKYIFGGRDSIPLWAGYRFGFKLVQQFIHKHPHISISEWTSWNAHDLIKACNYPN